jgi:hypothetical protein
MAQGTGACIMSIEVLLGFSIKYAHSFCKSEIKRFLR